MKLAFLLANLVACCYRGDFTISLFWLQISMKLLSLNCYVDTVFSFDDRISERCAQYPPPCISFKNLATCFSFRQASLLGFSRFCEVEIMIWKNARWSGQPVLQHFRISVNFHFLSISGISTSRNNSSWNSFFPSERRFELDASDDLKTGPPRNILGNSKGFIVDCEA